MKTSIYIFCAIFLVLGTRTSAQHKPPLEVIQSTLLPELGEGDFDHFAVDLAGPRYYVAVPHHGSQVAEIPCLPSGAVTACRDYSSERFNVLMRLGTSPTGTTAPCFRVVASITDTERAAEFDT